MATEAFVAGVSSEGGEGVEENGVRFFPLFFKYPKIPSDIDERRLSIQTNENGTALIFISPPPPILFRSSSIVDRIDSILLLSYIRKCIFIYWKFEKILGTEVIFHEWNPTKQICKYRTTIVEKVISPGKFLEKISATLFHVVFPPIFPSLDSFFTGIHTVDHQEKLAPFSPRPSNPSWIKIGPPPPLQTHRSLEKFSLQRAFLKIFPRDEARETSLKDNLLVVSLSRAPRFPSPSPFLRPRLLPRITLQTQKTLENRVGGNRGCVKRKSLLLLLLFSSFLLLH